MEPWLRQRLGAGQPSIEHIPQILDRGGDDPGATGTTDYEVQAVIGQMLDYDGGDGREWAFPWADEVCWRRNEAKRI